MGWWWTRPVVFNMIMRKHLKEHVEIGGGGVVCNKH
jgi:hypothetical protein